MFLSKKHVSRRTVLQGAGAAVALPLLDAMSPAATAWAQTPAGSTPKRFAFVGFPHGAIMDRWSPKETGTDFTMSPILEPLTPFRKHLTIVSGLRNKPAESPEPHGPLSVNRPRARWPHPRKMLIAVEYREGAPRKTVARRRALPMCRSWRTRWIR